MNREKIIKMAEEAGLTHRVDGNYSGGADALERFATAVEAESYEFGVKNTLAVCNKQIASQQARIDSLMLEFCPNEMTKEQIANWSAHQKSHEMRSDKNVSRMRRYPWA